MPGVPVDEFSRFYLRFETGKAINFNTSRLSSYLTGFEYTFDLFFALFFIKSNNQRRMEKHDVKKDGPSIRNKGIKYFQTIHWQFINNNYYIISFLIDDQKNICHRTLDKKLSCFFSPKNDILILLYCNCFIKNAEGGVWTHALSE